MAAKKNTLVKRTQAQVATTAKAQGRGLVDRIAPYLPPWLAAAALPPALGAAAHELWNDSATETGLACASLGLGGVALSAVAWHVAGGSTRFRRIRRTQAVASTAAASGWLTIATAAGPFTPGVLDTWLIGGALFAASWNVRQLLGVAPAGDDGEQQPGEAGGWAKLAGAIGLEKTKVTKVKGTDKGVVTAQLEVTGGQTVEDAQAAAGRLAAAAHVPPSGVTITKDTDNAALAHLKVRVADMLKDGVPFTAPAFLGQLPTAPIPVGLYADGEPVLIDPFSGSILQHLLVMGVTGAGKSEFARTVLAHLACRRRLSIMLVDLAKGRQTVGHIKDGIDYLIQDKKEAKRFLRTLPGAIKARGDHLGEEGLDQWTPDSSLNAIVVWLEEAADLADFEELDQIARAARSVGIWLVVSLQRATWTNMSTDVRANLQATACFGVNDAADAGFCLPDRVVEAGAVPDWGSDRPGYAYATGMGIPPERWTTEWRGALTDRDVLSALVAAAACVRDPLDAVTAEALGQAYAQREHRGTNRTTVPTSPAVPAAAPSREQPMPQPTTPDLTDEDQAAEREAFTAAYEETMSTLPPDPEPDAPYAHLRLEDDVPDADPDTSLAFEQTARASTEEARHMLYTELDTWARTGRLEFEPADLIPTAVAAGRKRPWLQGELKRLVEAGVLHRTGHGEYTIVQSPLVPA
ncbi:FtsK/SpoIIIE domain-containing protein [Streptomyces aidingensis]|uniref:FtsK domain-containing protein n=1 Tax=Streptomyces aidingensis TaxID=910347 RepID=A0A1I1UV44_9ACTN|nr:FtsK/SpoIIIE domain-containing protein [Streptomyces aidingensis]SFD74445.1 hypothetical protein SAMN05421773_12720 [Streptomyces aidingensis]